MKTYLISVSLFGAVVAAVAIPVALVAPKDESEREMVRLVAMKF